MRQMNWCRLGQVFGLTPVVIGIVGLPVVVVAQSPPFITEFRLPGLFLVNQAMGITSGPDGNLWFTGAAIRQLRKIGRINPTDVITEFPVPTLRRRQRPQAITAGPDGNLWFTETSANKIGRITPRRRHHRVSPSHRRQRAHRRSRPGPTATSGSPRSGDNKIGRITPTRRVVTEFPVPTPLSGPGGITAGPDGNLWFTELDAATRSARSRQRASSPSSPSRPPTAHRPAGSRPGPTATSGSPRSATARSAASRHTASSPSSPSPRPAATRTGSRPGPTATSGSPSSSRRQDRPHHAGRRDHRVRPPDGRQQPRGNHDRARRQPLVHRVRVRDRPHHDCSAREVPVYSSRGPRFACYCRGSSSRSPR